MKSMFKRSLSLLMCFMFISTTVLLKVSATDNLVMNSGFETGNSSGWSGYGGNMVVNNNSRTGSYCARVQANSAFEQVITGLNPGTLYTLKAWIKVSSSSTKVYLGAKEFGGQETNSIVSPTQYSEVTVNFRTGENNTSAKIYIYMDGATSGYSYGDDFEVTPYVIPQSEYNIYFGGFHDHTGYSDGAGTPDQAFQYAKNNGQGDFLTVTDHNNFGVIPEITSNEWNDMKNSANRNSMNNSFAALAGYEMTHNTWGHANVFNTETFFPYQKSLSGFYDALMENPNSIGQFNHPGWAGMNLFENFGRYSPEIDNIMELIEIGNGYGPIDRSGDYDWYYGSYITALDKGWHIAPANNQDNHKPTWLTEMPTRTAVLAHSLDRANIIDAVKNKRVYATEDKNLRVIYRVNGNIMGSVLSSPQNLDFNISVVNPEQDEKVKEIRVVADGGRVVSSKNCTSNEEVWNFSLPAQYSYYLLYVILENGCTAVTAPVWTGLPVVSRTPQITLQKMPSTSHEVFVVNLTDVRPAHLTDWVGLYEQGETPDGNPRSIWFSYLQDLRIDDNGNASFIFDPDNIPQGEMGRYQPGGSYKFIYAHDDSYTIQTSTTFTINSSSLSEGTNLALNKTATASSYWDNNDDPNCVPSNAVDGNNNTTWNAARDTSGGQWLEVDFGVPTTFNKVVTRAGLDRISGNRLQYWDGTGYVDIISGSRIYPVRSDVFEAVTAQKVRMYVAATKTDQNGWGISPRIDEFEVYYDLSAEASMQNYALNKIAAASSNWDNNQLRSSQAFDGNLSTSWNAARGTSANEWLEVDLGKPTTFNTIALNAYLNRISGYKLQYWDGSVWIDILNGGDITPIKIQRFSPVTAQKIRLYVISTKTDQEGWGADPEIDEIGVYYQQ